MDLSKDLSVFIYENPWFQILFKNSPRSVFSVVK